MQNSLIGEDQEQEKGLFTFYKEQQQQEWRLAQSKTKKKNKKPKSHSQSKSTKKLKIKHIEPIKYETIQEINQQNNNQNNNEDRHELFLKHVKIKQKFAHNDDLKKIQKFKTEPQQQNKAIKVKILSQKEIILEDNRNNRIKTENSEQIITKYKNLNKFLEKCKQDFYPKIKNKALFKKGETSNANVFMENTKANEFNLKSNLLKFQQEQDGEGLDMKKYLLQKVQEKTNIHVSHAINSIFQKQQNNSFNNILIRAHLKLPALAQKYEEKHSQNSKKKLSPQSKVKKINNFHKKSGQKIKEFLKLQKQDDKKLQLNNSTSQTTLNLINMSDISYDKHTNLFNSFQWKQKRKIIRQIFGKQL